MTIRQSLEQYEREYLSPFATLSMNSKGRIRTEDECDIRPVFQRDRDRIIHSLTHTLEVSQNARTIAKALRLNEDLAEAIALGHDLGHTPFGHAGERALNNICPLGFEHSVQSVRTVDILEKSGAGLNLTIEVRDGILNHQTSGMPSTLEGKIVRFSDKIAYIHHDMDDAIRGGILTEADIPKEISSLIGETTRERLNFFVHDLVTNSQGKNDICMSEEVNQAMKKLRQFMFERVYNNPQAKGEEDKAEQLMITLYEYYMKNTALLPQEYQRMMYDGELKERVVCDYVGAMTDRFAIAKYEEIYIPKCWHG